PVPMHQMARSYITLSSKYSGVSYHNTNCPFRTPTLKLRAMKFMRTRMGVPAPAPMMLMGCLRMTRGVNLQFICLSFWIWLRSPQPARLRASGGSLPRERCADRGWRSSGLHAGDLEERMQADRAGQIPARLLQR